MIKMSQFIQWFNQYPNKHALKYEWKFEKYSLKYLNNQFEVSSLISLYPELFCIPQTDQNSLGYASQAGETYDGFYEFIKMNGFVGWYEPELGDKGIKIDKEIVNRIILYWSLNQPEGLKNSYILYKKFKDGFSFDVDKRTKHKDDWELDFENTDFSQLNDYPMHYNYDIICGITKSPQYFVDYITNKYKDGDTFLGYTIRRIEADKIKYNL